MNALLQTLLAQRLGLTLPTASVDGAGASESGEGTPTDPLMAALLASFNGGGSAGSGGANGSGAAHSNQDRDDTPPELERYRRALRRARVQIEDDQAQLAAARRLIAFIGGIFGACPECWGLDQNCPTCLGQGQPGSAQAQPELVEWASPGLHQMGLRIVGETTRPQPTSQPTSYVRSDI
jgi:hypothetical protein